MSLVDDARELAGDAMLNLLGVVQGYPGWDLGTYMANVPPVTREALAPPAPDTWPTPIKDAHTAFAAARLTLAAALAAQGSGDILAAMPKAVEIMREEAAHVALRGKVGQ